MATTNGNGSGAPPIFIISGGAGALGKHVARIALSQFPGINAQVVVIPQVHDMEQLAEAVAQVAARNGLIFHTMVDPEMRQALIELACEHGLTAFDTIGAPLDNLSAAFGHTPLGQPGLYQGQYEMYLERIHAIEYTVDHDDGRSAGELYQADVVLTGVSRVGKTPLSIYLSVLGWKVANVPLVNLVPPPPQLFEIDKRRVIGLVLDVETLMEHRRWR
jgi:[pyruvate, water dikinase]-phosphate phosphotransferase / [pyruvate, water dikinase] kinase